MYGIQSLIEISTLRQGHQSVSALPPHIHNPTLVVKLYRREPAITDFDWNFSAIHKSSPVVSTKVGAVLHMMLLILQLAHE